MSENNRTMSEIGTNGKTGLNQYEWMLLHGDKLVDAIREERGMQGPKADKLLDEVARLDCPGRTRNQARKLLKMKLEVRGWGHLIELD